MIILYVNLLLKLIGILHALPPDEIFIEYENGYTEVESNGPIARSCDDLICDEGEFCDINDDGEANCHCIQDCIDVNDERQKICTKRNVTYLSDCELHMKQCNCRQGNLNCQEDEIIDQISYYGSCRRIYERQAPSIVPKD
ncbi:hypothetical protein ACOME3_009633 [Neoechinorhynchus agilis]